MFFLFTALMLANNFLLAQTNIPGGEVSGTWTKANSPYLVQGAIMIANDSTLTIEPGVSVIFQGGYKFLVMGRLLAVGTISDTITFTAADTAMGWRGIRFDNTPATNDTTIFSFCKFNYGKTIGTNEDDGGAFYFYNYSKVIISFSLISRNTAGLGSGISCLFKSSPIIKNNIISNNSKSQLGGGIYCRDFSDPTIINNTISNNTVYNRGAGIYCDDFSDPIISNNLIFNNSASYGGGIYCYWNSDPLITNNTFSNNLASSSGGGIFCWSSAKPVISNNIISNNHSSNGGGIYCTGYSYIYNNLIINNSASLNGGGLSISGNSPIVTNNTISNNSALKGGAIYCNFTSSSIFRNTIMWGNIASSSGNQVFLEDESSDPNFYFCNIQGGKTGFGLNTDIFYTGTYSNNIDADPLFVDTTSPPWSLQSGSPCINAGDTSGNYPSTDKAGNPRICDGRIDIGA